jgi:WD40 repeat protein
MQWEENRTNFDRNLAVVIGINRYNSNGIHDLKTAVGDAIAIAELLEKEYAYKKTDIIRLLDGEATFTGLEDLLSKTIPNQLKPTSSDRMVFYYAGHGIPRNSKDGPAGYLVPQDADLNNADSFLSMQYVYEQLSQLTCHHLLVILDCCFAGTFQWAGSRKLISILETVRREHYDRFIRFPAWQVITSSAHDQEAMDVALDNTVLAEDNRGTVTNSSHSPFALALIEGLKDNRADLIPDGVVTAHELYLYLEQRVSELSKQRQNPGLYPLRREYDRGEFIFTKPGFTRDQLNPAPLLDENSNPYRGLKSFDEKHAALFFGRQVLIDELVKHLTKPNQALTVVLGVSGSGKSSLVKAGLIPHLRNVSLIQVCLLELLIQFPSSPLKLRLMNQIFQWKILEPMRPGESPFTSLARTLLPITHESLLARLAEVSFLDDIFQPVLQLVAEPDKTSENETLRKVADSWCNAEPEVKLLLIEDYYTLLEALVNPQQRDYLKNLYGQILKTLGSVSEQLKNEPQYFKQVISTWQQKYTSMRLFLLIDQFEELLTRSQDDRESFNQTQEQAGESTEQKEWQEFLEVVRIAIADEPQTLRLLLTLRSDFEPRFLTSALEPYWKDARFPVRAMTSDELRQAIENPALKQALYFEELKDKNGNAVGNLVSKLVDEVGQMPGALPLLSFTLSELYISLYKRWQDDPKYTGRTLLFADYETLGGVAGALTRRATEEYESLDEMHQATMRRVMLRMVAIEGGGVARRRVPIDELKYSTPNENDRVTKVMERLINARLVVKGQEAAKNYMGSVVYIEPAHDFLVSGWDKLQSWIKKEQEDLALQQRLTPAANDWAIGKGGLWTGEVERLARLEKVLDLPENSWLNQLELEFFQKSRQQRSDELAESNRQRDEAIKGQVDALVSLSEMRFTTHDQLGALLASTKAVHQLRNRYSAQAATQTIAVLALLQSICNVRELNRLEKHTGAVRVVTFSPNGDILATASDDQLIKLWNHQGQEYKTISGHDYGDTGLCFSPDGKILASTSSRRIKFWNVQTGELITEFYLKGEPTFNSVCFSPNGKWLAAGTIRNTIAVWQISIEDLDISCEDLNVFVHSESTDAQWGGIKAICFSPNSTTIASASASAKDVKLWSLSENCLLKTFPNDRERCDYTSLCFNLDGQILAYADSSSKQIKLWQVEDGTLLKTLEHDRETRVVCFSHDGKTIASGDVSGTVKIWKADGVLIQILQAHNRGITSLSFSNDDRVIASASFDRSVKLWKFPGTCQALQAIRSDKHSKVAISSDAQIIAVSTLENTIVICETDGTLIETLEIPENERVIRISFSFSGQTIVIATESNSIYLRKLDADLENWHLLTRQNGEITDLSLSFTNQYMAFATQENDIYIWDFSAQKITKELKNVHNKFAKSLKFDNDDRTLLSTGWNDNSVKLWDLNNNSLITITYGKKEGNPVGLACFSTNSQVIATTHLTVDENSSDVINVIKLWNRQGELINTLIQNRDKFDSVNHVVFSSDGTLIVSATTKTIKLWTYKGDLLKELIVDNPPIVGISFCLSMNAIVGISADNVVTVWTMDGTLVKAITSEKQKPRDRSWNDLGNIAISGSGQIIVGTKDHDFQNFDSSIVVWNFDLNSLLTIAYEWLDTYLHSHPNLESERKLYQEFQQNS